MNPNQKTYSCQNLAFGKYESILQQNNVNQKILAPKNLQNNKNMKQVDTPFQTVTNLITNDCMDIIIQNISILTFY